MYRCLQVNCMDITVTMAVKFAIAVLVISIVNAEHYSSEEEYAPMDHQKNHDYYDKPTPYNFGYDVGDEHGMKHHYEESDGHGTVKGTYGYIDKNGIHRLVQYVADEHGFRAKVQTNEPGTKSENPADTHIQSEQDQYEDSNQQEHHMNQDAEQHSSHEDEKDGQQQYH